MGLISSQHSATRSRTGYLKHDDHSTRATTNHTTGRSGYDSHKMSAMRSQHENAVVKGSAGDTDSIDSGEMPIMVGGPSQKGSVGDFRSESGNGGANHGEGVYFRTAIRGGGEKGGSTGGGNQGIQMQTTVSVRTEPKRRGDDIV